MDHKIVPLKVKAAGPSDALPEGSFEGYCSVFGNKDSYGDIVVKGAFEKTLAEWGEKGDVIPLLWGHDFADPFSSIGTIDKAEEDDYGLKVTGTFDLENPKAQQVYRLAKGRRVTGMSFAYDVRDHEVKDDAVYLKDLHIYEASIVPIGANPEAGVTDVKSAAEHLLEHVADVKAGRVLAAKHIDSLRSAQEAIGVVIAAAEASNDQSKASDADEAKPDASDEEPAGAKSSAPGEEPKSGRSPVARLAAEAHLYALTGSKEA